MPTIAGNNYVHQLHLAGVNWGSDNFNIILMASGFTFNEDAHDNYIDVIANELGAGNGYTAGGQPLSGVTVTRNDANNRTDVTANDAQWNALGGDIGPSPGAIIYKNTGNNATSTVVAYIDFGSDQTAPDGAPFIVRNITVRGTTVAT